MTPIIARQPKGKTIDGFAYIVALYGNAVGAFASTSNIVKLESTLGSSTSSKITTLLTGIFFEEELVLAFTSKIN